MKQSTFNKINLLSILWIFVFSSASVFAQTETSSIKRGSFGLRFMPTFSSFNMKTSGGGIITGSTKVDIGVGALIGYSFTNNIEVQGELIYNSISQTSTENNIDHHVNLKYLNIPILLSLNTGKTKIVNLNAVIGPQIGFNIGSSINTVGTVDGTRPAPVLVVSKNDLGLAFGAGFDVGIITAQTLRATLGYRGVMGLLNISNNSAALSTDKYYILEKTNLRTNSIYIGLSLLF